MRTWGSTSSPGTSIAIARSTDSNGLSDRPSACAATRLRRAEPGPRAAAANAWSRATGKPSRSAESATASASSNGSRRPHIASVVVAFVASPSTCVVGQVRPRHLHARPDGPRRSAGPWARRPGAAAGTTLTFQPWCEGGAETRHTWPVTLSASSVPWCDARHGVPAPVDPHERAGRQRRLERSSRGQAHQQVARRHAAEDRHEVRDLHPPSVAQRQADRIVLHRAVVRTEQTGAGAARAGGPARGGRSVRSTVRRARSRGRGCGWRSSPS